MSISYSAVAAAPAPISSHYEAPSSGASFPLPTGHNNPVGYSPPQALAPLGGAGPVGLGSSKATTRILVLSEFSKDLKTRDIQAVFAEWEDERGGFKIKWVDDTSCLIVFADPTVAKRAFLATLSNPPFTLKQSAAKLRPYTGNDVAHILTSVQNRPRSRSNASNVHSHSRANSNASTVGGGGAGHHGLRSQPSLGSLAARRANANRGASLAQAQVQELIDDITGTGVVGPNGASSSSRGTPTPPPGSRRGSTAGTSSPTEGETRPFGVGEAGKRFITAGLGGKMTSLTLNGHSRSGSDVSSNGPGAAGGPGGLQGMTIEELPEVPTPRAPFYPTTAMTS